MIIPQVKTSAPCLAANYFLAMVRSAERAKPLSEIIKNQQDPPTNLLCSKVWKASTLFR